MSKGNFFKELKRRNVYKVAIAYGITAWLLAQIAGLSADTFKAPDWVMQMILIALIIGFPVALIFAWAFELSPNGIIRTDSKASEKNPFTPGQKRPLASNLLIGALILVVVIQFFYNRSKNSSLRVQEIENLEKSIAVLPLINLNQKNDNLEYFSDGVTQELIDELSKIRKFTISAFSSTYGYKNVSRTQQEIAQELGVNFIISGSSRVFKNGDSVKLSIELINPISNRRIWSESYSEKMKDAPSLHSAIAKKVAERLNINLSITEKELLAEKVTDSGEAFKLFLEAKAEFSRLNKRGLDHAIQLLRQALDSDPNYTQAHILMAWANVVKGWHWFHDGDKSLEMVMSLAEQHIKRALELNPKSSDAHLVKANFLLSHKGLLKDAVDLVEKAIELNSWPEVPTDYCICTAVTSNALKGNMSRAEEIAQLAGQIDPGNVFILGDRALLSAMKGDFQNSVNTYETIVQLVDSPIFHYLLGWAYYHDGQYENALNSMKSAFENYQYISSSGLAYFSNIHYKLGNTSKSNEYKKLLEKKLLQGEKHSLFSLALISAVQGNNESTLKYLERHQNESPSSMAYELNIDPLFKPLYGHPRFRAIREKMQYYN